MFDRYVTTPIIALGLAFLVWLYLRSRDQDRMVYDLPLHVKVDTDSANRYEKVTPKEGGTVRVEFYGLPNRLREVRTMCDQNRIKIERNISVPKDRDLKEEAVFSTYLELDADSLPLPSGVMAKIPEPFNKVSVSLRRIIEKEMRVQCLIHLSEEYQTVESSLEVEPKTVLVRGPKTLLDQETSISTEKWFITPRSIFSESGMDVVRERLKLTDRWNDPSIRFSTSTIQARVALKPNQTVYQLKDVPVSFLCPPNFALRPQFTGNTRGVLPEVRIKGPSRTGPPELRAFVDLSQRKYTAGLVGDELVQIDLPDGYKLDMKPPVISFQLELIEK